MVAAQPDELGLGADHHPQVLNALSSLRRAQDAVLDAVARVRAGVGVHGFFEGIQRQVHRRVAHAVDADLQAGVVQGADSVLEPLRLPGRCVPTHAIVGLVTIGHLGLAVEQELEASEAHEAISLVIFDLLQRAIQVAGPLQGVVHLSADEHLPFAVGVEVGADGVHAAHVVVVESGDAASGENRLGGGDVVAHHLHRGLGDMPPQHVHGTVVVEHPAWLAAVLPLDHPADRVRRVGGDASDLERQAVGRAVVPALLYDPDRVAWRNGIEIVAVGEPLAHRKKIPLYPLALWGLSHSLGQFGLEVVHGLDLWRHEGHVEALQLPPDLQMVVGVNQTRGHRFAAQVQHLGLLAAQGQYLLVRPHSLDEAILDRHRLGDGVVDVHGDDLAVDQGQVGCQFG